MNKEINLPIKAGERPLFKGLSLLETMYRDYKRNGNEYESIDSSMIFSIVAQLGVIGEILELRNSKGAMEHTEDIFRELIKLPLIMDIENVKDWEVKKIWKNDNFLEYGNHIDIYEKSFETLTPSLLYQVKNDNQNYVWFSWLKKTNVKDIIEIINYTSKALLEWNSKRKNKNHVEINLKTLSKNLHLSKNVTKNWFYLYVLGNSNSNIWDLFLKEISGKNKFFELIKVWEKSLFLENESISSLLYEDSELVNIGLFSVKDENAENFQEFFSKLENFRIPNLEKKLINQKNILDLFLIKKNRKEKFPLEMFLYLSGLKEKLEVINNLKNCKVLIYGKSLSGKKTLINSIITKLGYDIYSIYHKENEKENKSKIKLNELRLGDILLSNFNKSAILVDNAEEKYDLNQNVEIKNNTLQFWTIKSLEKVSEKFLKSFDIVIEMESMPLKVRTMLSKLYFKDDSLAVRVAQSIKDPYDILKIGRLCEISQNYTWKNIILLNNSLNTATSLNNFNLNKLEIDKDVVSMVGYPELSELLKNLVNYYQNPISYKNMGVQAEKGILLVGPPGTGKTHFVKNLSKEVDVPVYAPNTSELAKNIENINYMFSELRKKSPCILFLDEIDTLIQSPETISGVDLEKQKITNTFLLNLDGIEENEGILVIGTTHRKNNFDPAAIRSGRLNKIINLGLPNEEARKEIWKEHLKNKSVENLNLEELVSLSVGFSCSDIMEASNKAGIIAIENNEEKIKTSHLKIACDEIFWGMADNGLIISEKQKELIAYHEAGHALIGLYYGYNVPRITIRPRKSSLGATHVLREDGFFNMSIDDVKKKIQIMLGGICAEKIQFGFYENGGTGDLSNAKFILMNAMCEAGLSKEGPISLGNISNWSEERKVRIETEEKEIMEEQFLKTEIILKNNINILKNLAEILLERKEISGKEIMFFKDIMIKEQINFENKNSKEQNVFHNQQD